VRSELRFVDKRGNPISLFRWAKLVEDGYYAIIGDDAMMIEDEPVRVSTVWIGFDQGFGNLPLYFETMVFGGKWDQRLWRYNSEEEAMKGHKLILDLVVRDDI
jgi:hypothetical protein